MAALKSKIVRVSVRGNRLSVSPLKVTLRNEKWQVLWKCTGGRLTVKFKKGSGSFPASPFATAGFKGGAKSSLSSGEVTPKVRNTKKKHTFSYTLVIQPTQSGVAPVTVDPQIDVTDSGGGPGGGRGRSSRGPH